MSENTLRWQLSRHIRRALRRNGDASAIGHAYRIARSIPGVRQTWRLIDRNAHLAWADVATYASRGGAFGQSLPPAEQVFPPIAKFGDDAFYPSLIARIRACEPPMGEAASVVVLVNNGLPAGGAERQIVNTLLGLQSRDRPAVFVGENLSGYSGQDFYLGTVRKAGLDARPLERVAEPGLQMFELVSQPVAEQMAQMPPDFVLEILDMVRMLRAIRPRIVHLWQDETSLKHAISGLIAGVPRIILSGRNMNPTCFFYSQPYMRAAYHALLTLPQVVMSNNSYAGAHSYAEWLGIDSARIRVVRNGLDMSAWPASSEDTRAATRAALRLPQDAKLVLGVFRLSIEKRPTLWVDVAAEALKQTPNLRFAIAGEGAMQREIRDQIARLGIGKSVRLLGARKDIAALFMASDALLLTSENEGLPNVLLEAQWYGRPTLITPAGGATEAVLDGSTGRIAGSIEPISLARDLIAMLADLEFRARAAAEGPAFVERTFGLDRMVNETIDLYDAS